MANKEQSRRRDIMVCFLLRLDAMPQVAESEWMQCNGRCNAGLGDAAQLFGALRVVLAIALRLADLLHFLCITIALKPIEKCIEET